MFVPYFVVQLFVSLPVLQQFDGEERAGCFLVSCVCYCCVALPHGAMVWSAVCDCNISRSYSHFTSNCMPKINT